MEAKEKLLLSCVDELKLCIVGEICYTIFLFFCILKLLFSWFLLHGKTFIYVGGEVSLLADYEIFDSESEVRNNYEFCYFIISLLPLVGF